MQYSKAFKIQLVKEVEKGELPLSRIARKYGVPSHSSLLLWVRQFGNGTHGKVIRVQKSEEVDELAQLRRELKRVKEALADAHMDLALERSFNVILGEKAGIEDVEAFKKKQAGRRSTRQ
jgi:transposase-like protein